ncbi:phage tail tip lysozyme [Veillonella sp.]|uniref:phage tail tip lysozyme n=1 Tax=Veillonella sp. TaxID=1926307 RepID=UPI0025EEFF47|nr:phage tail tip lysozyme [Veillonella sp.]
MDNVIESYLIALGVDIDKSDFAEADKAINGLSAKITSNAAQWGKASGIVIGAISGIVGSITGMVASASKQDLAMQKYATSMMISTGQATKMKEALDALGESAADVQTNMELRSRYNALLQDAQSITPDGDYSSVMKQVRDVMFEFTRLKQEASYAIKWISYYLVKDFIGPLEKAGFSLRSMNEYIKNNMPRITRNIADGLGYLINIGLNFMRALKTLGMGLLNIWNRLPHSIKVTAVAMGAFFALLRASPVGRLVAVISMLLLLLDDFYAYMDGKESELGPYWQKLIDFWNSISDDVNAATDAIFNFLNAVSESKELAEFTDALGDLFGAVWDLIIAIGTLVADTFRELWNALQEVGLVDDFSESMKALVHHFTDFIKLVSEGIKAIAKFLKELGKTEGFRQFIRLLGEFLGILWDIVSTIVGAVYDALSGLWDIFKDLGVPREFTDAMGEMFQAFIELGKGVANLIKLLIKLFKWLVGDPRVMPFWKGVGVALGNLVSVLSTVLSKLGKIGRVIGLLLQGKFSEAAAVMGFGGGAPDLGEVNGNAGAGVEALVKGGMSEVAAAGLIGNMTAESSLDPTTSIIDSNGLRSIGIAQWNGERADKLEAYLKSKGINDLSDSRSFGAQLEYAIKELKEDFPDVWADLQNAKTVQEASDIILTRWEKPEDQSQSVKDYRAGLANQAYTAYFEVKNKPQPNNEGSGVGAAVSQMASSIGNAIEVQWDAAVETVGNKMEEIKQGAARLYDSIGTMTGPFGGPSYFVNPATTSTSNRIGDINVYVTNSNASAADIGNAVAGKVSSAINMPERPIVAVRERRGSIG